MPTSATTARFFRHAHLQVCTPEANFFPAYLLNNEAAAAASRGRLAGDPAAARSRSRLRRRRKLGRKAVGGREEATPLGPPLRRVSGD